jgi:phosphoheptose isomerase
VGRYLSERKALDEIALTTNTPMLIAVRNVHSFASVFEHQGRALVRTGDELVVRITSGQPESVVRAVIAASACGAKVKGITGDAKSTVMPLIDIAIRAPSSFTPLIYLRSSHCAW